MTEFIFKIGSLLIDIFYKKEQEKIIAKKDFKEWLQSISIRSNDSSKVRDSHKRLKEKLKELKRLGKIK